MTINVYKLTSWAEVLGAARFTQRKDTIRREPSEAFKKKIIRAEHSPLRSLMFCVDMFDIPYYAAMHFRTHKLVHLPLVTTARPDKNGKMKPREEQLKSELVNMRLILDAQELIAISKVRLCQQAEKETREIWKAVVNKLIEEEPQLAAACVPSCIYRGLCPEPEPCGFVNSKQYVSKREKYVKQE